MLHFKRFRCWSTLH